jgi:hypothetical protein
LSRTGASRGRRGDEWKEVEVGRLRAGRWRWMRTPVPSTLTPTPSFSRFTSSPYRFFRFDLFYTLVRCAVSLPEMHHVAPPDSERI